MTAPPDVHATVRATWEEVLRVPVDGDADFFRLGGDSLAAIAISTRLRAELTVRPRLRVLFDHPRFDAYVQEIDRLVQEGRR